MAHKNFEKMDNTENVEKVEQGEKTEGKEKESILSKVKNFFAEHGKNKESKEQKSEENDNKEEKEDKKGNSFRESLRVTQTPEEVAKYNKEHGVPDMKTERPKGGVERERGEDDPRWNAYAVENGTENNDNKIDTDSLKNKEKQEKIDAFNAKMDESVIKHGKMLENRRDLSIEEKNEMQAEFTEKAKTAKKEFAEKMNTEMENNDNKTDSE